MNKKTREMFAGIRRDAKTISDMSEDWLVNIMVTANKDLKAIRKGIDHFLRHEEVLNGAGVSQKQSNCESALAGATAEEAAGALVATFHGNDTAKLISTVIDKAVVSESYGTCGDDLSRFFIKQGITYLGPEYAGVAAHNCLKIDMTAWAKFRSTLDDCLEFEKANA